MRDGCAQSSIMDTPRVKQWRTQSMIRISSKEHNQPTKDRSQWPAKQKGKGKMEKLFTVNGLNCYETHDIYEKMKEYYSQQCIVTHWLQETMESGRFVQSSMTIGSALWQMKNHWIERATIEIC
jgi:hypothetical protein